MARGRIQVTYKSSDTARIPDLLIEGAAWLVDLQQRGILTAVGDRVLIRRQGGYSGLDVWLALLLFLSTGPGQGIRGFWDVIRPHVVQLASLAGRRRLPSPASLSRALDSVEPDLLREASGWLLTGVAEVDDLLRHPAMQTYDAQAQGWHVFDLDPTVTTLRHRALPVDDDLPEPRRRSDDTGAPGHAGRKRGDIQFRRITVQHAGSGVWVHGHLSPGNGEGVSDLERALDTVVLTCERLGHPCSGAMVRMDGEYGNVPWFTACRERGLPFITRLNRPKLYEDVEILDRLRSATWYRVPDSLAGPRRAAADLGFLTVYAGQQTRRPDGGRYEPIRIRVVASVFDKRGKAKRGRTLDGRQVELFAVDLPADAWPAPDALAAYFGRNAEENRFAQEDRELGLDRIISYHLPGQELATLVGLSLWNLRLVRGFEMDTPPHERPVPSIRRPQIDDSIPGHWPCDPVIRTILAELDWPSLLAQRPQWHADAATGELRCEEGRGLTLTSVRPGEHAKGRTSIIFRRPKGGCEACSSRLGCLRSEREQANKHAEFSIPTPNAERLRQRLVLVRTRMSGPQAVEPIQSKPGPFDVADALFLPATARHIFTDAFRAATLHVHVELPPLAEPRPRLVAADVAVRQRRRKTWAQNVDRYALPTGTEIRVEVAGNPTLRRMLGEFMRSPSPAVHAG